MESSTSTLESAIVLLSAITVLGLVLSWLFPDQAQELLDTFVNERLGTKIQVPFGVKDRYNIRSQMTELQPLSS